MGAVVAIAVGVALALYAQGRTQPNPDPNHTHADFAIWIGGQPLDFSDAKYMSGSSTDESTHPTDGARKYLHLHDGNGDIIHRHKPGLTFGDFLRSNLQLDMMGTVPNGGSCLRNASDADTPPGTCLGGLLRFFVNGKEILAQDLTAIDRYDFADGDQLLLTDATDAIEIRRELKAVTDEACRYSQTCPGRGKPPVENCISDPAIPCAE